MRHIRNPVLRRASVLVVFFACWSAFDGRPASMPTGIEDALKSGRSEDIWNKNDRQAIRQRLEEIRTLAATGKAPAQFVLGFFAEKQTNYAMAIYWYGKAADQG